MAWKCIKMDEKTQGRTTEERLNELEEELNRLAVFFAKHIHGPTGEIAINFKDLEN